MEAVAVAVGREATGETIDRERVSAVVYPYIYYWMGFGTDAVVIPHPGASEAGDDDGGVSAGAGAVILPAGERNGCIDDQEDGNYCIRGLIDPGVGWRRHGGRPWQRQ